MAEPEETQAARELRIVKTVVLAVPRALRWVVQNFMHGVRAGMANAEEQQRRKDRDRR